MKLPALYAIANIDDLRDPLAYVKELLLAGAEIIQLRAKTTSARELSTLCQAILSEVRSQGTSTKIIINDLLELCQEIGADGVHLGQEDDSVARARTLLGPEAIIGYSTHTRKQVEAAPQALLSYLAFGPVFNSPTKQGHAAVTGIEILQALRPLVKIPLVAIGGITRENAPAVFEGGVDSVAVISDLRTEEDKGQIVRAYEEIRARARRRGT